MCVTMPASLVTLKDDRYLFLTSNKNCLNTSSPSPGRVICSRSDGSGFPMEHRVSRLGPATSGSSHSPVAGWLAGSVFRYCHMSRPAELAFASLKNAGIEYVSRLCLSHSHKGPSSGAERRSTWLLSVCDKAPGANNVTGSSF